MTRLVATRVSDEAYARIIGKCAGLGCSVYDYLKMLVETDTADAQQTKEMDEKNRQAERYRDRIKEPTSTPSTEYLWLERILGRRVTQADIDDINRTLEGITQADVERILGSKAKSIGGD